MSPDILSSVFPDRPIRPLPKRRLRERLSPEVAELIKYPPAQSQSSPLFYYPSYHRDETPTPGANARLGGQTRHVASSPGANLYDSESDEEEMALRSMVVRRAAPEVLSRPAATGPSRAEQARLQPSHAPVSTASSVDGYDSFENTSNKKKRKIPSASDTSVNGGHSLSDLGSHTSTSISSPHDGGGGSGSAQGSYGAASGAYATSSHHGISGPGRGRFGRSRNGRSPLRVSSDANNWAGRGPKIRPPQWPTTPEQSGGIISNAIANAEKSPVTPGQENVSLLHRLADDAKSSPASTQFTFTCDSQVPGTQWPASAPPHTEAMPANAGPPHGALPAHAPPPPAATAAQTAAARKKKSQRRTEKEFDAAARVRREQATLKYLQNPPKPEDAWICEFCEYERIWGEPPRFLIRQYEKKDRRVRQQEEERKRLLEKAKAKSRKGKKAGKSPPKSLSTAAQPHDQEFHDDGHGHGHSHGHAHNHGHGHGHGHSTHDEYGDDDFDHRYHHHHDHHDHDHHDHDSDSPPMPVSDGSDVGEGDTCPTCGDPVG